MLTRNFGMPAIWGENLFEDWMGRAFSELADVDRALYGKHGKNLMKTDVRESGDSYQVSLELPGFDKSEISAELENGCLTVTASKGLDRDEKDEEGRYLRRERYSGTMQRSFYVGEGVRQEDIGARYENGVLTLSIPKQEVQKVSQNRYIAIEG